MKPTELHSFLSTQNIRAKKSLSQNFLIDTNVILKLIEGVTSSDTVIEIGPGPGAITEKLLATGCRVVAVEKDDKLAAALSRFDGNLQVIPDDILTVDLSPYSGAKVVANIPFHLTAPILARLLPMHETFSSLTLIMQKDVADRIVAKPGSKTFGSLSVFVQHYAKAEILYPISASCFFPKPKITAAAIRFTLKKPSTTCHFPLVRKAFGQRRKMLRSSLKGWLSEEAINRALASEGLSASARPEALSLSAFVELSKAYDSYRKSEEEAKPQEELCAAAHFGNSLL